MVWALEDDLGSWDPLVRAVPFAFGLFLLGVATMSIVRTMVVPRMAISFIYAVVLRVTDSAFMTAARIARTYQTRDRILAWSGPIGVMVALIVWLALFLMAYALMIFGITEGSFLQSLLQAGSGLLTLGLLGTPTDEVSAIDFIAAMTGPAVIALLIGFLPTLYQSYLSRESRVLLATGLTGGPSWGPETLARVQLLEGDSDLPTVYFDWIPWCAQVRLTQTLYPALNRFRSAVGTRNWLVSLVAVLDSAAIRLAVRTGTPDGRTVALLEQGSQTILSISATEVGIDSVVRFRPWQRRLEETVAVFGMAEGHRSQDDERPSFLPGLPSGISDVAKAITLDNLKGEVSDQRQYAMRYLTVQSTLPREEFDKALAYIRSAGVEIQRSDDEAFEIFRQIRGRYEAAAYHLAARFYVVRAPWTGDRRPPTPVVYPTLAADESTA
ncbi:MAG: hypothetical protein ACO3ID_03030 [Candidatus Nanopelagicales bacterium]